MRRFLILVLLTASISTVSVAEEYVTFMIPTKPSGALVKRNNEEWGLSGQEFKVAKSKLTGAADLHLRLDRKNYKEHQLVIPAANWRNAAGGGVTVTYPKSAIALVPNHPLVPLQENPSMVLLGLAGIAGIGLFVRRNRQLKRSIDDRESKENRLKDQIKEQHDFAFTTMGEYRILEQLGEGGIAKVFRAVPDESLDESDAVAIKILHPHLCQEAGHRERFIREGRVSQELIHPNLIRLFKIDMDDDIVYLVLELLKGRTLKHEIDGKLLSIARTREIVEQILRGLAFAHSKGVVHRDLTPSNIMLTDAGAVKLMDFGLARSREVGHTITVTGVIQGTPGYMAPEQLTETLDARTDQYSLGVILFEMLTGRRPIENSDPLQLIMATYQQDAPDPREFRADIPEEIAQFILRLLSRDPEGRFPDMKAAYDEFYSVFNASSRSERG